MNQEESLWLRNLTLAFWGLNGAIDAEVAQALLSRKNDITKIPASARYITDKKNGAVLYAPTENNPSGIPDEKP